LIRPAPVRSPAAERATFSIKLLDADEAVNATGGLPIIRATVDQGTAFDIAGQDRPNSRSVRAALQVAAALA
jgi:4-hydroxy-L-threonine phosphate dehydrogenase PdxA